MDELSCKTHCAVMRSVFNLPSASEGVQQAFLDAARSTRRTDGRREKQGRNVTKPNFARFLLEETLRDDPRIHLRKLSSALKFQGFGEMVNAEGDAARTQEPPSSSADARLYTSH